MTTIPFDSELVNDRRDPRIVSFTYNASQVVVRFARRMQQTKSRAVFRLFSGLDGLVYEYTNFSWSSSTELVSSTRTNQGVYAGPDLLIYMGGDLQQGSRFLDPRTRVTGSTASSLYSVNLAAVANRFRTGAPGVAVIGDSIWSPLATPRLFQGALKNFQIPIRGLAMPLIVGGDLGNGFTCVSQLSTGGNVVVSPPRVPTGWRPGEQFPSGGEGVNCMAARVASFSGDVANFGSTGAFTYVPSAFFEPDSDLNQDVRIGLLVYGSLQHPLQWRIRGINRSGTAVTDTFLSGLRVNNWVFSETPIFNRGNGASINMSRLDLWNEVEGPPSILHFQPIKKSIRFVNKPTGAFWTYFGHGGWNTKCHLPTGATLPTDGGAAFLNYYTDGAIDAEIAAYGLDTAIIHLGQNIADNEWNGTTIGEYGNNINAIADRFISRALLAGRDPLVLFVSPYDTNTDSTRYVQMENALAGLATGRKALVRLRSKVSDTYGNYSAWSGTLLSDGIHPSTAGRDVFTQMIWQELLTG